MFAVKQSKKGQYLRGLLGKGFQFSFPFKHCFNLKSTTFPLSFPSQSPAAPSARQAAVHSAVSCHAISHNPPEISCIFA